jgi:hypothetical protein
MMCCYMSARQGTTVVMMTHKGHRNNRTWSIFGLLALKAPQAVTSNCSWPS